MKAKEVVVTGGLIGLLVWLFGESESKQQQPLNGLGEYFETHNIKSLDDLKKEYYRLAKKFHPDAGGSTAEFQALGKEYDKLLKKILAGSDLTAEEQANEIELDGHLRKAYEAIMTFPGIVIELAGKWLWVSGQTYPIREELKKADFKFASKKKMWYYAGVPGGGKGNFSMEEIRGKYGSQKLRTAKEFEMLSGPGTFNKSQFVKTLRALKKSLHKRKS